MDVQEQEKPYHKIGRWGCGRVRSIKLTARDLDYLQALFTHRTLSSAMLRALAAPDATQRTTRDRLYLLKNRPNEYVIQPETQKWKRNACGNHLVFEMAERGAHSLVDLGRVAYEDFVLWEKLQINFKPQHFDHDRAVGYALASFELGARQSGIRFISWREILNRPRCPTETKNSKNPIAIPYEANGERHLLIPDGLFGLQYPGGACFFALEIDMGTEQQEDNALKSATLRQKFRAYRIVMREKLFASRFGLPSLLLLMITPSSVRQRNMMEHVSHLCDQDVERLSRLFLFKAAPQIDRRASGGLPLNGDLLAAPWDRPDHPQLNLASL